MQMVLFQLLKLALNTNQSINNFIVIKYKKDGVKMVGSILISFIEYNQLFLSDI
jgi:hypothetical protein